VLLASAALLGACRQDAPAGGVTAQPPPPAATATGAAGTARDATGVAGTAGVAGASATSEGQPAPLLPADALGALRLGGTRAADARLERVAVEGQPFGHAVRARTEREPQLDYHIQLHARTTAPVEKDDVLHVSFWLRGAAASAETGEARTAFIFERAAEPYTKSITLAAGAPGEGQEWRRVEAPFKALERYAAGEAQVLFRLGYAPQTVEIGGLSLVNHGKRVALDALPRTTLSYAGREPGAAWRREAEARIEQVRTGDLAVTVVDAAGRSVPGAAVAVRMTRSAFGFGSAVAAGQLVVPDGDGDRYREHVTRLFNVVVMENDLKWPNWEDQSQRARTLQALDWLRDRGLPIRGHTLVWPSWRYLPADVQRLRSDPDALRRRVAEHIVDEAGALRGRLVDWDVVNEPHQNHDLMDILGDEVLVEWFRPAREHDPTARLFLNEATVPAPGARADHLIKTARFLQDRGAPLDGIGIQCHYGMNAQPPAQIGPALDRFAALGLPIQLTEFDVDTNDETLQADFTRDFLLATFSHPAVDAVLMWGFWAGRHWRADAALYRRDWSAKPNAEVWSDLVLKQWRTDVRGQTDGSGAYRVRGFLGEYEIEATAGQLRGRAQATLTRDGATVRLPLQSFPG
jgi:endo-1,4-beta-xylanase